MVRVGSLILLFGTSLVLVGCSKELTQFDSKEHKFSVLFPGAPQTKKQAAGPVTMTIYYVDGGSTAHFVFHQQNPPEAIGKDREVLEGAKIGMSAAGKVLKSSDIQLDGKYPGIEVYAEKDGKTIRDRVYVVGDILYQVMVVGSASFVDSADSNKFMNSFKYVP